MLINLSNHPSSVWKEEQTSAAIREWESIQDIPFPEIDPECGVEELKAVAAGYYDRIVSLIPVPSDRDAVHLMGEMGFTFMLVHKLLVEGYNVVASTTERQVKILPDGTEQRSFAFCRFREYRPMTD